MSEPAHGLGSASRAHNPSNALAPHLIPSSGA